jgi:putative ABC transport system permease protein
MALGALSSDVVAMVLRQAAALTAIGLAMGGTIALLAGRFIEPALFDVSSRDPFVFTTVAVTMLTVALLAGLLPAMRAARVDPVVTLRSD